MQRNDNELIEARHAHQHVNTVQEDLRSAKKEYDMRLESAKTINAKYSEVNNPTIPLSLFTRPQPVFQDRRPSPTTSVSELSFFSQATVPAQVPLFSMEDCFVTPNSTGRKMA